MVLELASDINVNRDVDLPLNLAFVALKYQILRTWCSQFELNNKPNHCEGGSCMS